MNQEISPWSIYENFQLQMKDEEVEKKLSKEEKQNEKKG